MGLYLRDKTSKCQVKAKLREDRAPATQPSDVWAIDFVHDQLATGCKIRVVTVIDTFSRFLPVVDPRFGYRVEHVAATLERVCAKGGARTIRDDQGSEIVCRALDPRAYAKARAPDFCRRGKLTNMEAKSDTTMRIARTEPLATSPHPPQNPGGAPSLRTWRVS